jgi:dihydrofolate reductase
MARVIVSEFLTVDGVMQAPGSSEEDAREGFEHGGWQVALFDDELGEFVMTGIHGSAGMLLGRRTYEIFAGYWPLQPDDDEFAALMNPMPKYVASTTLQEPLEWQNSTLLRDVPADVARLKADTEGDVYVIGSGVLARSLMEHDLVDRYQLMVHPLVLGTGRQLFPGGEGIPRIPLRLVDSRTTPNGIVILTYEPKRGEDA